MVVGKIQQLQQPFVTSVSDTLGQWSCQRDNRFPTRRQLAKHFSLGRWLRAMNFSRSARMLRLENAQAAEFFFVSFRFVCYQYPAWGVNVWCRSAWAPCPPFPCALGLENRFSYFLAKNILCPCFLEARFCVSFWPTVMLNYKSWGFVNSSIWSRFQLFLT